MTCDFNSLPVYKLDSNSCGPETLYNQTQTIPAKGSLELPLHNTSTFSTSPNTYGVAQIQASSVGAVLADLVRIKQTNSQLEFASPTPVR